MKIHLSYTSEANFEKVGQQAMTYISCLVTGRMSSLQPESVSVVMHDWDTYAGLISATWIIITLWEPEFSTISAWALQSHGAQCGCMLEAICSRLYLCGLDSALLTLRMKASSNPTSHCSRAASGRHTAWSALQVVRRTQRGPRLLKNCLWQSSMSLLRRKSCYKAFYLGFVRV